MCCEFFGDSPTRSLGIRQKAKCHKMCNQGSFVVENVTKLCIVKDTFFDFVDGCGASLQRLGNLTHGVPLAKLERGSEPLINGHSLFVRGFWCFEHCLAGSQSRILHLASNFTPIKFESQS